MTCLPDYNWAGIVRGSYFSFTALYRLTFPLKGTNRDSFTGRDPGHIINLITKMTRGFLTM